MSVTSGATDFAVAEGAAAGAVDAGARCLRGRADETRAGRREDVAGGLDPVGRTATGRHMAGEDKRELAIGVGRSIAGRAGVRIRVDIVARRRRSTGAQISSVGQVEEIDLLRPGRAIGIERAGRLVARGVVDAVHMDGVRRKVRLCP